MSNWIGYTIIILFCMYCGMVFLDWVVESVRLINRRRKHREEL